MPKHEIVVPDDHLPAWIYLHDQNQSGYIEPHWHTSVEISYTLSGSINNFCTFVNDVRPKRSF